MIIKLAIKKKVCFILYTVFMTQFFHLPISISKGRMTMQLGKPTSIFPIHTHRNISFNTKAILESHVGPKFWVIV